MMVYLVALLQCYSGQNQSCFVLVKREVINKHHLCQKKPEFATMIEISNHGELIDYRTDNLKSKDLENEDFETKDFTTDDSETEDSKIKDSKI